MAAHLWGDTNLQIAEHFSDKQGSNTDNDGAMCSKYSVLASFMNNGPLPLKKPTAAARFFWRLTLRAGMKWHDAWPGNFNMPGQPPLMVARSLS
ncbi:hypothetical protein [Advenella sp. FME57]|uniref:hypothetical protein n=1 Tax=Advenella sp. FME57 TaxID=2742604 RepID=UPI001868D053|nr:hypothetical protein [Advenella sp. FME57]